jgi:hypothetical protein
MPSRRQALSADDGELFAYEPDRRVAVALPTKFRREPGWKNAQGFATVSSIFQYQGNFYAFAGSRGGGAQPVGNCLMRTHNLTDPASWRAWDGHDFTVRFDNPYTTADNQASERVCRPIRVPGDQSGEVRSVSWDPDLRVFIAIVRGHMKPVGSDTAVTGIFYSTSSDLFHWKRAGLIMKLDAQGACKPLIFYPSILDPAAKTPNFEDITAHSYVYYSRFNISPGHCNGTMDRDLMRVPLNILVSPK